jgi:pimeloyl-ACP methyl ester carboxylesterase
MTFNFIFLPLVILTVCSIIVWLSLRRMLSPSLRTHPVLRKIAERIVLSVVVMCGAVVGVSTTWNAIAIHRFWSHHPAPGRIVDVGGRGMHIDCTGSGTPVLVLEAGGQNDSSIWRRVQPELSKTTTVCSYDRAGFGWSDDQPGPRDADHIASELHALLAQAGVNGPFVLMGHSIGGLFIRDYAARYPADVAGLIFVDSSTPFQEKNAALVRATPPKTMSDNIIDFISKPWTLNLAVVAGTARLLGICRTKGSADDIEKIQQEQYCRLRKSSWDEVQLLDQSSQETVNSGPFGAIPILVLSRDTSKGLPSKASESELDRREAWNQMQENLKKLSTRSQRIVARNSSHFIMMDRRDLVEREVPIFIREIRGSVSAPTYGSTETE